MKLFTIKNPFKHNLILTELEQLTYNQIVDVIKHPDTLIDCDTIDKIYIVHNEAIHYTATVLGQDQIIRTTNTIYSNDVKYRLRFMEDVIDYILSAEHSRVQSRMNIVKERMLTLAKNMHSVILEHNANTISNE